MKVKTTPEFYSNFFFLGGGGDRPPSRYLRVWMTGLPLLSRTGFGTDSRAEWAKSIPV